MSRFIRYLLFGLIFIVVGLLVGFRLRQSIPHRTLLQIDTGLQKIQDAIYFIEENYVEKPNNTELVDDAIKGMLEGLDPHSFYIPAEEMEQMEEQMSGGFEGIGIEFNIVEDTIYVVTPLDGGPSKELGIRAGDRIIKIDGETVAGVSVSNLDVMNRLKGDKGTDVELSILRRGTTNLIDFQVTRDKIPLHSVSYSYMINDETGYIDVNRFSETTYKEFHEHLGMLLEQGMQNLVLDLRGNPGGYLSMAHKMADEFLPGGELVVSTKGRIPESRQTYHASSRVNAFEEGALIVLIDYGSASASEIVAGAVQDHDRGLIVGVRSFGKGLVQVQKKFDDKSAIRIVISEYYTPSGRCIQKPYKTSSKEYDAEISNRFETGEIFDASKIELPDSLKFYTSSGRTVYGGGGIVPDVFVAPDTSTNSQYLTNLQLKDMFSRFSFHYVEKYPNLRQKHASPSLFAQGFKVDETLLNEFIEYTEAKGVAFDKGDYQKSKQEVNTFIKALIGKKLFDEDGLYPVLLSSDNVLQEALKLIPEADELQKSGQLVIDQ